VRNLALFQYLLPSLVRTADCGFRYAVVLGYDKGDPFYDSIQGKLHVDDWFNQVPPAAAAAAACEYGGVVTAV
jgi:hypothetical protein